MPCPVCTSKTRCGDHRSIPVKLLLASALGMAKNTVQIVTVPWIGVQLVHVPYKLSRNRGLHRLCWEPTPRTNALHMFGYACNALSMTAQAFNISAYSYLGMSCEVYLEPKRGSSALP